MPILGCDYSGARPSVETLKAAGIHFACRYLSYSAWKNLTRAEAARLRAGGIAVVSNWETSAGAMLGGRAIGMRHAKDAAIQHANCGGDPNAPIYFSHDVDPRTGSLAPVMAYLDGAASVLGVERVGVYGGYKIVNLALNEGYSWGWQTYAWSSGKWDARAAIRQTKNGVTLPDGSVIDYDHAYPTNYGQWYPVEVPEPRPEPVPTPKPAEPKPATGGPVVTNVVEVLKNGQLLDAVFIAQFDERGVAVRLEWASGERRDRYVAAGCPVARLDLSQVKACSVNRVPAGDRYYAWTASDFSDVG